MSFVASNKILTGLIALVIVAAIAGAIVGVILATSSGDEGVEQQRKFSIDYEQNTFLMDGESFRYVSGSFHYFRSMPGTWRQKLQAMRAGGLNAVDVYVHWALHNPEDGVYRFDGIANVEEFIRIATEEGLFVILRPGPYICAEIDNGGLPYWLATKYPGIKLRESDPNYLREIEKWYSKLMPQLEKHLYGNGGNIIMVQVENEYGGFPACDKVYKDFLRNETEKYTGANAVLFTTDFPWGNALECGKIDGVFATTDFGQSSLEQVESNFKRLRQVQPNGPLVNSEFYTGWFTAWQGQNSRRNAKQLAETLEIMLLMGANINFYMYYGGTNFGFWSGADVSGIGNYMPDITSYDYDSPLDESGNPTEKYEIFRDVIKKYIPVPDKLENSDPLPAMILTSIQLTPIDTIFSTDARSKLASKPFATNLLPTFEQLEQFSGFVLYETILPTFTRDPSNLVISNVRDRALVYIDDDFVGVLSRENYISTLPISAGYGSKLSILVENQGRINYGVTDDYKGIIGTVRIQSFHDSSNTFYTLTNWTVTGFPFDNHASVERLILTSPGTYQASSDGILHDGPVVFHGEFIIPESQAIRDTYWDTEGWGKGFVFINGFNLGRYWPLVGPQITIYVPAELLKYGRNEIQIIELQKYPTFLRANFHNRPIFINDQKI